MESALSAPRFLGFDNEAVLVLLGKLSRGAQDLASATSFALGGRSPAVSADLASTLRQGLDLATNRSHFHVHPISGTPARGARTGDQSMAFRKTRDIAEHDQPVETDVEGEIREFVRRDVVTESGRRPDNESQLVANNINSVLQQTTATSVQEIDKLITELQAVRDMLHSEAARVQREIVQYSTLNPRCLPVQHVTHGLQLGDEL